MELNSNIFEHLRGEIQKARRDIAAACTFVTMEAIAEAENKWILNIVNLFEKVLFEEMLPKMQQAETETAKKIFDDIETILYKNMSWSKDVIIYYKTNEVDACIRELKKKYNVED